MCVAVSGDDTPYGTHDRTSRLRIRASAAGISTTRSPDLQAFLATAYFLQKTRRPPSTNGNTAGSSQLFSSLVSLLRKVADLESDVDDLLTSVAQHARALTLADAAAVALLEEERVVCRARAGPTSPTIGTPIELQSSFTGQSFCAREVLYCEDTEDDPRVNRTACRVAGIRSILVVPVERQRQSIGIVEVFSASPARFGASDIRALELLAEVVADGVRARSAVEVPRLPAPVAITSAVAQPVTTSAAASAAAPGSRETTAPASERTEPEQQLVVERRPRTRTMLRPLLVFSALSFSFATAVFFFHERRPWKPLFPQTRSMAATAPTSTLSTAEPVSAVATGPGILRGVKYNSRPDFTSVEIGLSGPVKVKTEHLTNPERIYFDLAETRIASEMVDDLHMKAIAIGDRLVSRVRIAQKSEDVARVVIDLNRACEYSYVMSESPPFRLVVEVHTVAKGSGAGTEPERSVATPASIVLPASETKPKAVAAANRPLKIVIDPGHGGWDLGSVGPTGLQEKEVVLDVAKRLGKLLKARLGAETILTRADDTFVPLEFRSALANSVGANLFLSVHGNSSSGNNVRGVETFYVMPAAYKGNASSSHEPLITSSRRFASAVQHELYVTLSGADPLVQNRGVKTAALSVLEAPTMPSVLTEISFVSSTYEEQKLRRSDYRDTIAEALFKGIKAYASGTR